MPFERRRHERVHVRAEARVVLAGRESSLTARDVSLGGAYLAERVTAHDGTADGLLRREPTLQAGQKLMLIILPDEDAPNHAGDAGNSVRAAARIVRRDADGIAVRFEELDLDNHARLLALVDLGSD
jgi:hypothetical protein